MNIQELVTEAYGTACEKGWHDTPRTFGEQIALIHSELSEALEAYRVTGSCEAMVGSDGKPEGVPSELADAVIRIADMCGAEKYDLEGGLRGNFCEDKDLVSLVSLQAEAGAEWSLDDDAVQFGDVIALLHAQTSQLMRGRASRISGEVAQKLGALVLYIFGAANSMGVILGKAIESKLAYNKTRSHRHGGKVL